MRRCIVGTADEFPAGSQRVVEVDGESIGVFNLGGELYAVRNRCPHQGGPLCSGRLLRDLVSDEPGGGRYVEDAHYIQCPWHGWEFDIRTGASWFDPARRRVQRYSIEVESRDRDYVVVTLPR